MKYHVPDLHYEYRSLEPYIDRQTMEIHHRMHHASYVNKLNAAIDRHAQLKEKPIEDLLLHLHDVPYDVRMLIRNNGGGHVNHSILWQAIGPPSGDEEPVGDIADFIRSSFGRFAAFKDRFSAAARSVFGSGLGVAH